MKNIWMTTMSLGIVLFLFVWNLGVADEPVTVDIPTIANSTTAYTFSYEQDGNANYVLVSPELTFSMDAPLDGPQTRLAQRLGLSLRQITDEAIRAQLGIEGEAGIVVEAVSPDSSAHEAGLRPLDIVLAAGDHRVATPAEFYGVLLERPLQEFAIKVVRDAEPARFVLAVPETEEDKSYMIGVHVEPVSETLAAQLDLNVGLGLVVSEVVKEGPAEQSGVEQHDVLIQAGASEMTDPDRLRTVVESSQGSPIRLRLMRRGKALELDVEPVEREAGSWLEISNDMAATVTLAQDLRSFVVRGPVAVTFDEDPPQPSLASRIETIQATLQTLNEQLEELKQNPPESESEPESED